MNTLIKFEELPEHLPRIINPHHCNLASWNSKILIAHNVITVLNLKAMKENIPYINENYFYKEEVRDYVENLFLKILEDYIPTFFPDLAYEKLVIISSGPVNEPLKGNLFSKHENHERSAWYSLNIYNLKGNLGGEQEFIQLFTVNLGCPFDNKFFEIRVHAKIKVTTFII